MKAKRPILSMFIAALIFAAPFSIAANHAHGGGSENANAENPYYKLDDAKKRELERHRKDMVDEAKRRCVSSCELKKGEPLFLRAVHCPELVGKVK